MAERDGKPDTENPRGCEGVRVANAAKRAERSHPSTVAWRAC